MEKFTSFSGAARRAKYKRSGEKGEGNGMANQGSAGIQTKGLTILEDQMQHEFLACKKAEQYAKTLTNPSLQTLANDLAMKHRTHFDRLFNYLNSHA